MAPECDESGAINRAPTSLLRPTSLYCRTSLSMDRSSLLQKLRSEHFDLLVIGGGATGAGIALEGASRGLKVALVERDDYASGTSSRSTKLIHGGVRYLQQAVLKLDRSQFYLVRDALHERATLVRLAPHLSHPLPIVTPIYNWFGIPYYRVGLKVYDWLAGKENLSPSRFLSAKSALKNFPMLKAKGLRGGVRYFDAQFNDARMNVSIILTAIRHGATCLNHAVITRLLKENNRLCGALVLDPESGEEIQVRAKVLLNAAGPFVDSIRHMDDPDAKSMLRVSSGIHIVLDKRFSPPDTGLLIPKTEDGRVLFLLPWLGHTLVGTTDNPARLEANPQPQEEEIQYILRHLQTYFEETVRREDIRAAWSGLRPLVSNPKAADTAKLSRDHIINISSSGLITVAGGKWTTYRRMAVDAVDQAIRRGGLNPSESSMTHRIPLEGAEGYSAQLAQHLSDTFKLDTDIAFHLARSYGGQALQVLKIAEAGYQNRLVPDHPYLEAEILYAVQNEFARNAVDILARRMRLTFLDAEAARKALPRVLDLAAPLLGWSDTRRREEEKTFFEYLGSSRVSPTVQRTQITA